jgi:hypothetical protein
MLAKFYPDFNGISMNELQLQNQPPVEEIAESSEGEQNSLCELGADELQSVAGGPGIKNGM